MLFFAMAASIMAVCIIAIHKVAKYIGRELPLSSLVLCGISAISINFLIISVMPFLTKTYYYILGTMIVFAATGTTCYNKYLLYRKSRPNIANIPQVDPDDSVLAAAMMHTESPVPQNETKPKVMEPSWEAIPILSDILDISVESTADTAIDMTEADDALYSQPAPIADDTYTATAVDEPMPGITVEPDISSPAPLESMKTLDDILDFAFEQTHSQPQAAIQAYKYALERYRSDEYAPFIVIDMVNLYQAQEQYLEAMDCIYQAMELPAIQENPATRQNFQSYLSQIQALYHSKEPR